MGQREDSHPGQEGARFYYATQTDRNLKLMNCLVLKFSSFPFFFFPVDKGAYCIILFFKKYLKLVNHLRVKECFGTGLDDHHWSNNEPLKIYLSEYMSSLELFRERSVWNKKEKSEL